MRGDGHPWEIVVTMYIYIYRIIYNNIYIYIHMIIYVFSKQCHCHQDALPRASHEPCPCGCEKQKLILI